MKFVLFCNVMLSEVYLILCYHPDLINNTVKNNDTIAVNIFAAPTAIAMDMQILSIVSIIDIFCSNNGHK